MIAVVEIETVVIEVAVIEEAAVGFMEIVAGMETVD